MRDIIDYLETFAALSIILGLYAFLIIVMG
jgi:hypothetical protein